jgi:hypothetical protein
MLAVDAAGSSDFRALGWGEVIIASAIPRPGKKVYWFAHPTKNMSSAAIAAVLPAVVSDGQEGYQIVVMCSATLSNQRNL